MVSKRAPTETSPLLGEHNGTAWASTEAIANHDAESGESRQVEEQGKEPFPDARKQLKYIVPAISIGVWIVLILSHSYLRVIASILRIATPRLIHEL